MNKEKNEAEKASAVAEADRAVSGGKFLTFFLAGEEYGLEILKVQEIIGIMDITPVPRTPAFVKGVINLRGKIVPVVDLRLKFGMEEAEHTEETCIIVVQISHGDMLVTMGVVVDQVSEVMDIDSGQIEDTPEFGVDLDTRFILGIGKIAEKVVIILDANKVLTAVEINKVKSIAREAGSQTGE